MQKAECKTCPFFGHENVHFDGRHYGTCRPDPPVAELQRASFTRGQLGVWSWIADDEWCGRHPLVAGIVAPLATHVEVGAPTIED